MKALVVAYDLPPLLRAQAIQVGRLLRYLPVEHRLYVVTAEDETCTRDARFYEGLEAKFADTIKARFRRRFMGKVFTKIFPVLFEIPDIFLYWHLKAYVKILKRWGREKFDCIMTFPYPFSSNVLGLLLKRRFKTKWITFFSDPWAENPHFGYKGIAKKINLRLEAAVMRSSDMIVFASPEMRALYIKKYPQLRI